MNHRMTTAIKALAFIGIGAVLVPAFIAGQAPAPAARGQAPATAARPAAAPAPAANKTAVPAAKAWTMPHTPDGQPDLQGYWTNATYTPLERAANVTKQFYTKEEYEAAAQRAAQTEQSRDPGVHYDFTQFGLDKSQSTFAVDLRTAMITDPPDGRVPAQTAEAQKRTRDRAAAVKVAGAQGDSVQTIVPSSRCVIYNPPPGPPMLPQGYDGNYQIVQSPGNVMIYFEQIGDIRIIPLDGRPAPPSTIRNWMGISRGHWEGDTLVVETTNFNERTEGRPRQLSGISENFKLIERFKRIDENTINYEFTVNDPATFVKPWTASMPFAKIEGPIFEPACHEGNYGLLDTMKGYRVVDASKKTGQ